MEHENITAGLKMQQGMLELYKWLVLVPIMGISTVFFGVGCIVAASVISPGMAGGWFGTVWARLNAVCAMMRVSVEGRHHLESSRAYVIVANHQSQFDILVVYGWLGLDFRWVMKKELRKVPVLGICCERLGHIFIDRSDRSAAISAINRAKEEISDGTSVFFFPEGTRSRNGRLLPFKKGAFRMAVDLQLPILPVTIVGTRKLQPPDTLRFRPGRVRLVIHPPIETAGYGQEQVPGLMLQARDIIKGAL